MKRTTLVFWAMLLSMALMAQNHDYTEKIAEEKRLNETDFSGKIIDPVDYNELIRGGTIFFQENFTGQTGIPEGWFIQAEVTSTNDGAGYNNWSINNSSNAGGQSPELRFNWQPVFTEGYSRMVTPAIAIEGNTQLELFFRQRLSNFTPYTFEYAYVEFSTDGGDTWTELWSMIFNQTYGPIQMQLPFDLDNPADSLHIGFRFSGYSYNIFNWSIDDILLRSMPQEDLEAGEFSGPNLLVATEPYAFELGVFNNGQNTQTDYTVKLMKVVNEGDDVVLAETPGTSVEVGQTVTVAIPWQPGAEHTGQMNVYGLVSFGDDQDLTNNASSEMVLRVLPEGAIPVSIGTGNNFNEHVFFRIPFDFYYKNSLAQVMYYPSELGDLLGTVQSLVYYSSFAQTVTEEHVRIYLGTTSSQNFFNSNGFIPAEEHTLVYDGPITIGAGESVVLVELDTPFLYTGGNLVVTTNRVFDQDNPTYNILNRYYSTNTPQFVDRTIRNQSNSQAYDPLDPPPHVYGGYLSNWHPNTSFVFSLDGVGMVEGVVTDNDGNPLENVFVKVDEYPVSTLTDATGAYSMFLPAEELTFRASLFGYYEFEQTITIAEGETLVFNIEMEEIPTVTVSGWVGRSDSPETGIENAAITLAGYSNYEASTMTDGSFSIPGVYVNETYDLTITYPGYYTHQDEVQVVEADLALDAVLLQEVPFPVSAVTASLVEDAVTITWEDPLGEVEYRYDDGNVVGQLGFPFGNLNSVMGAVHRRNAQLHEMSWLLTNEGGGHSHVKVWVFGLDENGHPDRTQVLFSQENVPNTTLEWNTFVFPEPLSVPGGFMIGVSAPSFLALAHDNGFGFPWDFKSGTQYASNNINSVDFFPMESQELMVNFMIRAVGYDFGDIYLDKQLVAQPGGAPELINTGQPMNPFSAGKPQYRTAFSDLSSLEEKVLETYSVYRLSKGDENDSEQWALLAEDLTTMEYTDTGWMELPQDFYRYAVVAFYTNDVQSLPAFSNALPKDFEVEFTISVTTNSGDSPSGAALSLTNQSGNPQHVYTATVGESGEVIFPLVWKGTYDLTIALQGFETYLATGIEIDDDGGYDAQLIELLTAPIGLEVITDGQLPGEALFRWNTIDMIKLFQHDGEAPAQPNSYFQQFQLGYGVVYDLSPYPDAIVKHIDFYHMQWGLPNDNYPYLVHLVDWDTKQIIETIGPLTTQLNDTWETEVDMGSLDLEGVSKLAILIQPQGNVSDDAYPVLGADVTGPSGVSVYVNMNNLNNFHLNGPAMGDFLMNLWILTAHGKNSSLAGTEISAPVMVNASTRLGEASSSASLMLDQQSEMMKNNEKSLTGYDVFLNDMETPLATGITEEEYLFAGLDAGGHIAGVRAVYTSGDSELSTLPFTVTEGHPWYNVTFRVHMHATDFDPGHDVIYITGSHLDWAEPGSEPEYQAMQAADDDPRVYKITLNLPAGAYEYKYFLNTGWSGGEWAGEHNRVLVLDQDKVIDNVFGDETDESLGIDIVSDSGLAIWPNPVVSEFHIASGSYIHQVKITDLAGRLVYETEAEGYSCTVRADFGKGIYLVRVFTSKGVRTEKISVVR